MAGYEDNHLSLPQSLLSLFLYVSCSRVSSSCCTLKSYQPHIQRRTSLSQLFPQKVPEESPMASLRPVPISESVTIHSQGMEGSYWPVSSVELVKSPFQHQEKICFSSWDAATVRKTIAKLTNSYRSGPGIYTFITHNKHSFSLRVLYMFGTV